MPPSLENASPDTPGRPHEGHDHRPALCRAGRAPGGRNPCSPAPAGVLCHGAGFPGGLEHILEVQGTRARSSHRGGVQDSFAKGRPYRPLLDEVDTDAESIARSAFGAGQVDERELQVRVGLIVEIGLAVSVLFPEGPGAEEFDGYDTVIVPDFRDPGAEHRPDLLERPLRVRSVTVLDHVSFPSTLSSSIPPMDYPGAVFEPVSLALLAVAARRLRRGRYPRRRPADARFAAPRVVAAGLILRSRHPVRCTRTAPACRGWPGRTAGLRPSV